MASITLNKAELDLKFTLGVIEDFCEDLGIDSGWENEINKTPKNLRMFIYHMVKHNKVNASELKDLEMSELIKATAFIEKQVGGGSKPGKLKTAKG